MKISNQKVIELRDWNDFVQKTYGRPYNFQQQDGCKSRGVFSFDVPDASEVDKEAPDSVDEVVNGKKMGVNFEAWLKRDPKTPLANGRNDYGLDLWWKRNFYPDIQMIANDLHAKGLLEAGSYMIVIDW